MAQGRKDSFNTEHVTKYINNTGYLILDNNFEYTNILNKVNLEDVDGYRYYTTFNHVKRSEERNGKLDKLNIFNPYSFYNLRIWANINNKKYIVSEGTYISRNEKSIVLICKTCGRKWKTSWRFMSIGFGCRKCNLSQFSNEKNSLATLYPSLLKEWDFDKNIRSPFTYAPNSHKKVFWICSKCGMKWNAKIEPRIQEGVGCPYCSGRLASEINNLAFVFPELLDEWDYEINGSPYDYTPCSCKKVGWVCLECGNKWKTKISYRTRKDGGTGCPNCASSKGEKKIKNFLTKNNIQFIRQYKFEDCKNIFRLPFDFYLPKYNVLIEYDGEYHYSKSKFRFKDKKRRWQILDIEKRDVIKTNYCQDKNIPLIRIPYWEKNNIESILEGELNLS